MTAMLNLDDLTSDATKTLRLKGVDHQATELTVEGYINRVKRARAIPTDAGVDVQIAETVKLLVEIFPTVGEAEFLTMPLRQLSAVIEFALNAPEDIAKQAEQPAQGDQAGNA